MAKKFNTKIIQDNIVYLPLSDAVKALGYKQKEFINSKYRPLIAAVYGLMCIKESDYNKLLTENASALQKQGQIEVTKIETLRSKIDSVMGFQGLKMLLARDYLQMMADRTGCASKEEYIITHELPAERRRALQELMQDSKSNSNYRNMVEYLNNKAIFDIEKLHDFGLDVQYLVSIKCDGRVDIDAYVVGKGVFCSISDIGDYAVWDGMYIDENGDMILPYCEYDSQNPKLELINLSNPDIDHDFRKDNVVGNMIWCINNLDVTALEDCEYSVFGYFDRIINFDMSVELLVKILKPAAVSTIYTDKLFEEDFSD